MHSFSTVHQDELATSELKGAIQAIEQNLQARGLSARQQSEASVLVYCHAFSEIRFELEDLAELPLPPMIGTVLLLRPVTERISRLQAPAQWRHPTTGVRYLALDPVRGVRAQLAELLSKLPGERREASPPPGAVDLERLLRTSIGLRPPASIRAEVELEFTSRGIDQSGRLAKAVVERLENGFGGVLEACFLLTNDYSALRHGKHSTLARPYAEKQNELGKRFRHLRFLEHWSDLRHSLSAILTHSERLRGLRVLILDDNPDQAFRDLNAAVSQTLLGRTQPVEIENPIALAQGDEASLRWLAEYSPLKRAGSTSENGGNHHEKLETLLQKVAASDVVLVDQFVRMPRSGRDEMLGARLVRGLRRLLRDNGDRVPEFVALSRTDDPQVIQDALSAGAREYIVKSRFVSLPAVLGRILPHVSAMSPHRNFRELYGLPAETIGLLRSAVLPKVPFHQTTSTAATAASRGAETFPNLPVWLELLKAIPKPELHVHAGSVMSREFLVIASLVMFARPHDPDNETAAAFLDRLNEARQFVQLVHAVLKAGGASPTTVTWTRPYLALNGAEVGVNVETPKNEPENAGRWIDIWGGFARSHLVRCFDSCTADPEALRDLRATLHRELGVRDHLRQADAVKALERKSNLELAFFLIRHASGITGAAWAIDNLQLHDWKLEDLVRIYLLALASKYQGSRLTVSLEKDSENESPDVNVLELFGENRLEGGQDRRAKDALCELGRLFFSLDGPFSVSAFRAAGWAWRDEWTSSPPVRLTLGWEPKAETYIGPLSFGDDPIGYTLATGTRSQNLQDYLLGCEFAGAEHLRHPYLIHVYCRQVVFDWIALGVVYAELKASPDGYVFPEIGFDYAAAAQCFVAAFSGAQYEALSVFRGSDRPDEWAAAPLGNRYTLSQLRKNLRRSANPWDMNRTLFQRLPCKVSLVFVGKRHKALREMILEAAAAAVLKPAGDSPVRSPADFVDREFAACRVVGFDLAGPEDGNPPSAHAAEFGRLGRLHVPITVHAGENAGPQFIEDAILTLGAVRIGHGLSLAEDRRLIARVRDERIAIELCPVCNHQTSHFHSPGAGHAPSRPYPLRDFLTSGLYVSINTDNPVISDTNIVREYLEASYATAGLTLWEMLRLVRMGFVTSFLPLQERKHVLSLVGEHIFDLLRDEDVVQRLRILSE